MIKNNNNFFIDILLLVFCIRKTDKFEGIVPDVLDLIAKKSGFKFTYVPLKQGVSPLNQVVDNPDLF